MLDGFISLYISETCHDAFDALFKVNIAYSSVLKSFCEPDQTLFFLSRSVKVSVVGHRISQPCLAT